MKLQQLREELHTGPRFSDMGSCSYTKGKIELQVNNEDGEVMN